MSLDTASDALELTGTARARPQFARGAPRGAARAACPADRARVLAGFVSAAGSPPVLIAATVLLATSLASEMHAVTWGIAYLLIGVAGPVAYLVARLHDGDISDLDVERREERLLPQVVTVACLGLALIVTRAGAAPPVLSRLALLLFLQAFTILNVTLRWKISVHSAVAAMTGCVVWTLTGSPLGLSIGLPAVMWSRIHLGRHTPAQTFAGAALGTALFLPAQGFLLGG